MEKRLWGHSRTESNVYYYHVTVEEFWRDVIEGQKSFTRDNHSDTR